jgi:hypothetical protein
VDVPPTFELGCSQPVTELVAQQLGRDRIGDAKRRVVQIGDQGIGREQCDHGGQHRRRQLL